MRYQMAAPLYSFLVDQDGQKSLFSIKQLDATCACGRTSMYSSSCRCGKAQTVGVWELTLGEGDEYLTEVTIPYTQTLQSACAAIASEMDGELSYFGSYDECLAVISR